MILKTFALTCLLFLSTQVFSDTNNIFRVSPYTLKHPNGHLLLNFQTNDDQNLIIDDNGENKLAFNYKKFEQYKVQLNVVPCGSVKEFKILDSKTLEVLYKNVQPPAPCSSSSNEQFVFGFISDTQELLDQMGRHDEIAKTIAYHHAIDPMQFIINGGDVVQEGAHEVDWINYFQGGKIYLKDVPQIAAIGNHDYRGADGALIPKFFNQFMRWQGSDKDGNLFFDFPELQIVILNSNFSMLKEDEENTWKWLEEKLSAAQKIHKLIIIATHFPVYASSLNRFESLNVIRMRTKLVPLVEKYKVPLVLSGHTHMYERSYKDSVNYLVAGPAGGRANHPTYKNKFQKFFDQNSLTFTQIKLTNRVFTIETYNQDNKMIDNFIIDLSK